MKEDLLNNMQKYNVNCIPFEITIDNVHGTGPAQQKYVIRKSSITYTEITEESLQHALNQIDPRSIISKCNKDYLKPISQTILGDVRKTCSTTKPTLGVVNKMPRNAQVPDGNHFDKHARSYTTLDEQIKEIRKEFTKEMQAYKQEKADYQLHVMEFVKTQQDQKRKIRFSNQDTISLQRRLVTRESKPKRMGMRDFKAVLDDALQYELSRFFEQSATSTVSWEVIKPKIMKRLLYSMEQYIKEHQPTSVTKEYLFMQNVNKPDHSK
jgi:phage host-nuclease inhibitor protein Gam